MTHRMGRLPARHAMTSKQDKNKRADAHVVRAQHSADQTNNIQDSDRWQEPSPPRPTIYGKVLRLTVGAMPNERFFRP
jgi:hypothetical protein